jgi:hypothetical protein
MEILDINQRENDWWAWFTFHNAAAVDTIIAQEGFTGRELSVDIKVNGVSVLSKDFNKLMDELVKLALEEEMKKRGLTSVMEAATVEAQKIIRNVYGDMEGRMADFTEQLRQISESANSLIQTHYDAPFVTQTTEGMQELLRSARIEQANNEDGPVTHAVIKTHYLGQYGNAAMECVGEGANEGEARIALEKVFTALIGLRKF